MDSLRWAARRPAAKAGHRLRWGWQARRNVCDRLPIHRSASSRQNHCRRNDRRTTVQIAGKRIELEAYVPVTIVLND